MKNSCDAVGNLDKSNVVIKTAYRPGIRVAAHGSTARVSLPISIEVRDNGSGVAEEMREHLFDPFISSKQNGSGLGLALVAKIVGDHGGVVSGTREGGETVFRVLLPVWNERENNG